LKAIIVSDTGQNSHCCSIAAQASASSPAINWPKISRRSGCACLDRRTHSGKASIATRHTAARYSPTCSLRSSPKRSAKYCG